MNEKASIVPLDNTGLTLRESDKYGLPKYLADRRSLERRLPDGGPDLIGRFSDSCLRELAAMAAGQSVWLLFYSATRFSYNAAPLD
jgi:hypothetical protein